MASKDFLTPSVRQLESYPVPTLDKDALRLKDNENPFPLPPAAVEALLAPLSGLAFNRYPDSNRALRERIGRLHHWPAEGVMLGNGSDEIIQILLLTFGRGKVLVHQPTFVMYEHLARVLGRELEVVPLEAETWDIPERTAALSRQAGLVFFASPNSPTGNAYSRHRLEAVLQSCPGVVVLDEAYAPYGPVSYRDYLDRFPDAVILRTFSKIGLAGLRLGYLLARPEIVGWLDRVRLPYNVNAAVAAMALSYLDRNLAAEMIEPLIAARGELARELAGLGITVYPSQANFLFCRHPKFPTVIPKLREQNIWIKGFAGALADCSRISVGTPADNARLLAALAPLLHP